MARPLYILHRERSISPQSGHLNDCFYVSRCLEKIPHMTRRINICSSHSSHLSSSSLFVVDLVSKAMAALAKFPLLGGELIINKPKNQSHTTTAKPPSESRLTLHMMASWRKGTTCDVCYRGRWSARTPYLGFDSRLFDGFEYTVTEKDLWKPTVQLLSATWAYVGLYTSVNYWRCHTIWQSIIVS